MGIKAAERGILASLVSLIKSITPLDNTDEWEMDDAIYSVITSSAINANGKGKSLTMPEGDMQAKTIKEAFRVAGRDPAEAFYVELHATGTKVGDPIEINAAGKVFSKGRDANKTLRTGSVKANIGHAEGCSFLASLVKVSMMLHHKEIIPNIRFQKANPKIDFPALKMQVQTELEAIKPEMAAKDGKWVTSISSYGVGGSNAHIVLETAETVSDFIKSASVTTSPDKKPLYLFSIGSLTVPAVGCWKDATLRSLACDLGTQSRAYAARSFAVASTLDASTKFSKTVLSNSNASPNYALSSPARSSARLHGPSACRSVPSIPQFDQRERQDLGREVRPGVYVGAHGPLHSRRRVQAGSEWCLACARGRAQLGICANCDGRSRSQLGYQV